MTLWKPPPIGVVTGPFRAVPVSRIAAKTDSGSGSPPSRDRGEPGIALDPVDRDPGRVDHRPRRARDLGSDTVAGEQGHAMSHEATSVSRGGVFVDALRDARDGLG